VFRSLAAVVLVILAMAPGAGAASATHLTQKQAIAIAVAQPKIASWLHRYDASELQRSADYDASTGQWSVRVDSPTAGEVASATIDDQGGRVTESLAGPQVAWQIARGGGVGGKTLNRGVVWVAFCLVFLVGLADFRRPLSLRNLDLLVLLSFSFSLWEFNRGHVFAAASLAYPPLAYLIVRCAWIARRGRATTLTTQWPVWILVGATVFLTTFRIGLDYHSANVIDVGYAGVIGAQRIVDGTTPYGTFPRLDSLKPCGPPGADGVVHDRVQANGRCERELPTGDTYGPVTYESYIPGLELFGWTGHWDRLPAARFSSVLFDLLALGGMAAVGWRFGGEKLAATLAFAWVAYPFTQYAPNSGTNDVLMPALLLLGFLALTSPASRGAAVAASGWSKFAAFIVAPLWATYPTLAWPRRLLSYALGFAAATAATVWIVFLDGRPLHALRVFYDRTLKIQYDRHSPFSLWDWGQYHAAGIPDLHWLQQVLQVVLVLVAVGLALVPRRKSPLQLAALTALLIAGFEAVLTHWSYYYIPWFFPFAALAVFASGSGALASAQSTRGDEDVGG
jgi:hypothetical protein